MADGLTLAQPRLIPSLDPDFRPVALANCAFQRKVAESSIGMPMVQGLERAKVNGRGLRRRCSHRIIRARR
jgi:hypothetical protein